MLEEYLIENTTSQERIEKLEKKILRLERDKNLLIKENRSLVLQQNKTINSKLEVIEAYLINRFRKVNSVETKLELKKLFIAIKEERNLLNEK